MFVSDVGDFEAKASATGATITLVNSAGGDIIALEATDTLKQSLRQIVRDWDREEEADQREETDHEVSAMCSWCHTTITAVDPDGDGQYYEWHHSATGTIWCEGNETMATFYGTNDATDIAHRAKRKATEIEPTCDYCGEHVIPKSTGSGWDWAHGNTGLFRCADGSEFAIVGGLERVPDHFAPAARS